MQLRASAAAAAAVLLLAWRADAHPAPFSYLNVHVTGQAVSGQLVVHVLDVAHDLALAPDGLGTAEGVRGIQPKLIALLASRVRLNADGGRVSWRVTDVRPAPQQDAIEVSWVADLARPPGLLVVDAQLFPYDPLHQTFVNVYEHGALVWRDILDAKRTRTHVFSGTRQGRVAVFADFTKSGIHHIAMGPDHILFVIGLLLLGGSIPRLLGIVTAFTIGHSATLALATLNVVDPPAGIVEPVIALSIVYVGADNLVAHTGGRDVRPWVALAFGLVHGFGFASVLREMGLPHHSLALSLFSFNLGVEIGQAAIVVVVASAMTVLRHQNASLARRVATAGSAFIMTAGALWFVQRVFAASR